MNADGSGMTTLTNNPFSNGDPDWSPDGTKIAFSSLRDGNSQVYVMNTDGSGQTNLTNDPSGGSRATWSPDGTKIAFVRFAGVANFNFEIFVMNADGSGQTNLTNHLQFDHEPAWQPLPSLNQPPTADAGGVYSGDEGSGVILNGSGSSDPDGHPLSFDWDFGDGSAHGSGGTPVHVYADNGTYTITLTVDDGHGGSDVATTTATIDNMPPQVNAGTASSIQSGQTLNFSGDVTDAGSADTPASWTIDWGDGTTPLSGHSPVPGSVSAANTYYGTGTFTLQLTVTDKDGGVGTGSRTVTVDPRSVTIAASPDAVSLSEKRAKQIDIIIFSASGLDATQIDPATLSVGDDKDPDALPVQRKNGAYVLNMRDVNHDGLRDLTLGVEKLDPNLGLAAPSTTLVVRGAVPTSSGPIVLRGSVVMAVSR